MSVRIRMKKMGRTHRPFFRICAIDKRAPRDGRALEELGTYDPSIPDVDARAVLNKERIAYWLSVGALPSEKCAVLIKKYGEQGTHLEAQQAALEKLAMGREIHEPTGSATLPKPKEEPKAEGDNQPDETPAAEGGESAPEAPPADTPEEQAKAEEAPAEETPAEEPAAEEKAEEKTEE